jgi:mRNA interferase MazF
MPNPRGKLRAGEIVNLEAVGVIETKVRPVVVLSSAEYHAERPDLIYGFLTTQLASASTVFDYVLMDWDEAGLRFPSAFRSFLASSPQSAVRASVGHLSERDWIEVRERVRRALAVAE